MKHTPDLPGIQTRKAKGKVEMRAKAEKLPARGGESARDRLPAAPAGRSVRLADRSSFEVQLRRLP